MAWKKTKAALLTPVRRIKAIVMMNRDKSACEIQEK